MLQQFFETKACYLPSLEATLALGKEFSERLSSSKTLFLQGDLGSGKTSFSKGFIHAKTGMDLSMITSPTFVYMNAYETNHLPIYHFDLYRLKSLETFYSLGFEELITTPCIALIEWPEILKPLHLDALVLNFRVEGEGRKVEWIGGTL